VTEHAFSTIGAGGHVASSVLCLVPLSEWVVFSGKYDMIGAKISDRINWGRNVVARRVGVSADAYRPKFGRPPLAIENRYLKLPALILAPEGSASATSSPGTYIRHGHFDGAYTQPGDYLIQEGVVYFIGSQYPLAPILCVETNRQVYFMRPSTPETNVAGTYGGITTSTSRIISDKWPACVVYSGVGGAPVTGLPADTSISAWVALLPRSFPVKLQPSDIMQDDLGRRATIISAEDTGIGNRIYLRQAST
jgi:hypothetical protein